MKKPFIDFYTQIGFAPTGQLFGNQDKHRENRSNLYRKLGLHPKVLEGSTVLEIGPGSGENSIDLLARGIKSLKLVDGVPAVLESLQSRISGHTPVTYELYDASMLPPKRETFDIVICEGVIPLQLSPGDFFRNVSTSVAQGGILLVTTFDSISGLSEILRRIIATRFILHDKLTFNDLEVFFQKDFDALRGMTRTARNWLLDSVANPWIGDLFSLEDAISSSHPDFRPISMTPNLHLDLNWYKNYNVNSVEKTEWINSYNSKCHQLIDYRFEARTFPKIEDNLVLRSLCTDVFLEMQKLSSTNLEFSISIICELLDRILKECNQVDNLTKLALSSFIRFMETDEVAELTEFRPFWGRGQQYICFQKD